VALTNAEKQARHRERVQRELDGYRVATRAFLDELSRACEEGRCARFTNHLPDEPFAALEELRRRLESKRLVVVQREDRQGGDAVT
jgi:hypothetical protein